MKKKILRISYQALKRVFHALREPFIKVLRGPYLALRSLMGDGPTRVRLPDGPIRLSKGPIRLSYAPIRLSEDHMRLSDGPLTDSQRTLSGSLMALPVTKMALSGSQRIQFRY
jgi:hypothetical protein